MTTTSEPPRLQTPARPEIQASQAGPAGLPAAGPESRTGGHDLPVLEAYRGLASVMVVVTHVGYSAGTGVSGPWSGWLSRLDFGVALFFLLSGFLLFRPFVQAAYGRRPPVAVGAYLRRRFVRIYPALLVAIAANYLLTPDAREQSSTLWWQTVFLVQNYPSTFTLQLHGLVQLWSLVVEVSFYAALPILAWLLVGLPKRRPDPVGTGVAQSAVGRTGVAQPEPVHVPASPATGAMSRRELREFEARQRSLGNRLKARPSGTAGAVSNRSVLPAVAAVKPLRDWRPVAGLLAMVTLAVVWRVYYVSFDYRQGAASQLLWLPPFLDWFAIGMAMAWLRERPSPVPMRIRQLADAPGVCWSLALAGYWLITTTLGGPKDLAGATTGENLTKHFIYAIIGGLLLLPAIFGDPSQPWREVAGNRFFTWLGQVSFGMFLWHPMLMEVIRSMLRMDFGGGGFWLTLVLTLIVSGAVATLSWKFIEAPLQKRWRDGFGIRRPRPKVIDLRDPALR